ncbi:MAG: glycine cleavage system aminomethyltransferase GcvT [Candidatus Krumholzibacteriia bacterium]
MSDTAALKSTPLTAWHRAHGAKMVEYAGYEMPVQYAPGTLAEHAACRQWVGLFDITHMGELEVTGPGAEAWLDSLVTNKVAGIPTGKVVYNAMCRDDGGVLDDMLVYRLDQERWLVVCNAANHAKIAAWMQARVPAAGVAVDDQSDRTALIAVQGPDSRELVGRLARLREQRAAIAALDFYTAFTLGPATLDEGRWLVSRTGYTGEHGYELYLRNADALPVWEELMAAGADLGAVPVGLAARDTLRFEVCYCLYGHELAEDISPLEAGIGWAVKLKKGEFTGRAALQAQKDAGVPRRLVCLEPVDRGIPRQGQAVKRDGRAVGFVTSGTFSPTLKRPLAMALVASDAADGDLTIDVRGRDLACRTVPFPFLPARTKGDPRAERPLSS